MSNDNDFIDGLAPLDKCISILESKYPGSLDLQTMGKYLDCLPGVKNFILTNKMPADQYQYRYLFIQNILDNVILSVLINKKNKITETVFGINLPTRKRSLVRTWAEYNLLMNHHYNPLISYDDGREYKVYFSKDVFDLVCEVDLASFRNIETVFTPPIKTRLKREREDELFDYFSKNIKQFLVYNRIVFREEGSEKIINKINIDHVINFLKYKKPVLGRKVHINYATLSRDEIRTILAYIKDFLQTAPYEQFI